MTMTSTDQERERELNTSLSESLACRTCTIRLPRATYHRHLQSQIYVPTRDPPFRLSLAEINGLSAFGLSPSPSSSSPAEPSMPVSAETEAETETENQISPRSVSREEDANDYDFDYDYDTPIAPHATLPRARKPGYQALMTATQREAYEAQIKKYIADMPGRDVAMARYHVDYHVHLHWLSRRGVLTLCRDVKEMHELRRWRWRMAQMDVLGLKGDEQQQQEEEGVSHAQTEKGCEGDEDAPEKRRPRKATVRRWGWPGDSHLFMMYQTALWRQRWLGRQKHLDEVRIKWAAIMAERHRQRKCVKVKLFWGHGYKNLLREIELEEPWFGEQIIR